MNSHSTYRIFVVVLLAHNAPIQGDTNAFTVYKVVFVNGQTFISNPNMGRYTGLIKLPGNSYEIREIVRRGQGQMNETITEASVRASFAVTDFTTMIWNTVILATNIYSLQIQLLNVHEAQLLFELAGRDTLLRKLFTYRLTAVYEYGKGRVLGNNGSISGFDTAVSASSFRYVIHTGGVKHASTASSTLNPFLLWTAHGYNYCVYNERSIVLTLFKPNDKTYSYYLVQFVRPSELFAWKTHHGEYISSRIPEAIANPDIFSYFNGVYIRTD